MAVPSLTSSNRETIITRELSESFLSNFSAVSTTSKLSELFTETLN